MYKRALLPFALVIGLAAWIFVSLSSNPEPQVRNASTTTESQTETQLQPEQSGATVAEAVSTPEIATAGETDFDAWLVNWKQATTPAARASLEESGAPLATQRSATMKRLIREDPDAALERALSYADYAALPEAIQAVVEEPFSDSGSIDVTTICSEHATNYRLEYSNGDAYAVFMPSLHRIAGSKKSLPIQGIRLDGLAVLRDTVFQTVNDADLAFVQQNWPSGQSNPENDYATGQPIEGSGITAIAGGHVFHFQNEANLQQVEAALQEADAMPSHDVSSQWILTEVSADGGFPFEQFSQEMVSANYSSTTGDKTALIIMVNFQDVVAPANQIVLEQKIDVDVSNALAAYSYNTTSMDATVYGTVLTISSNAADYLNDPDDANPATKDYNDIYSEAVAAYLAHAGGGTANPTSVYDTVCVYFGNAGFSWAGLASVGGQRMWLENTTSDEVILHEFGHNYGLKHANYWVYDDSNGASTDPVDPTGASDEYGDDFDVMGSGSTLEGHFHMGAKQDLGWIGASDWEDLSGSGDNGTYRVYRFDDIGATGNQALRISKSATSDHYWIGYRKDYASLQSFAKGAYLTWERAQGSTSRNQTWLVDTTPQSANGINDAPISLGRTYSDTASDVHITPVALGGSAPNEYIDVVVNFGAFAGNAAPTGSISGPTATNARQVELFSASATDSDGDTLAYSWDMGDGVIQSNSASITHSWAVGGTYMISVTVSDMKGGSVTLSKSVTVTDPLSSWSTRTSTTTQNLNAIASNGTYAIAVGDSPPGVIGNYAEILRSTDGITWTNVSPPSGVQNLYCKDIIWDGTKFLMAGYDYDFGISAWEGVVYSSTDGSSWTRIYETNIADTRFYGIASDQTTIVAVGESGLVASNGSGSWAIINASVPSTKTLTDVAYGDGNFIAVGRNNFSTSGLEVRRSTDGISWSDISSGTGLDSWKDLRSIEYTGTQFVASGYYARVLYSTDQGTTWNVDSSTDRYEIDDFATGAGITYAVGTNDDNGGADVDLSSANAINWSESSPGSLNNRYGITFFNNTFITVGASGSIRQSGSVVAGTDFDSFTTTYFPGGGVDAEATANSDNDWADNFTEYALGGDPTDGSSTPSMPAFSIDVSGFPVFEVTRAAKQTDVAYSIWWSTNLTDWTQAGLTLEVDDETTLRVRGTNTTTAEEKAFFRLLLSQ